MPFDTPKDAELAIQVANVVLNDQMYDHKNEKVRWPLDKVFNCVVNAILMATRAGVAEYLVDVEPKGGLVKVRLPEVLGINPMRTVSERSLEGYLRDEYSYFDSQRLYTVEEFERRRPVIEDLWGCPVVIKRMGDNPRGVTILPAPPPIVLPARIPLVLPPAGSVVLGTDVFTGEVIADHVSTLPHLLIAGTSGFGKSVFLNSIIKQLLAADYADVAELVLVDLKGGVEFHDYAHQSNRVRVVWEFWEVVEAVESLIDLMLSRQREMVANNWRLYPGQRVFFIVDEFAQIQLYPIETKEEKATHARLLANLNKLSMLGRAVGIVLFAAIQKPTADGMDSSFRMNLQGQVCFKVPNRLLASTMFGSVDDLKLDPVTLPRGRFIYYDPIAAVTRYLQAHVAAD